MRAGRGYVSLRYPGYPRDEIKVLHGGFSAWRAAASPSTTDVPAPKPVRPLSLPKQTAFWWS